ncbi:metallophosphoesterase family protein [Granulicella sp. dw_53]|uniref:metallophosphoesterase family protein n=1 Tax=Granulicella sp. dw_53 TaxID=2719792 RepID=UPI001BD647CB|nr:metallophosphoesterase family protein [Granulicella sp. dw_53]
MRIGVISDTHGLLRPEALAALAGVDHILHAGDVGDPAILDDLRRIAPLTAIRGNVDVHGACADLPETDFIELDGKILYLVHSESWLDINPTVAGVAVVVSGHSHKPSIEDRKGILYLNPGSAGPRRFKLPVTVAIVQIDEARIVARIVDILAS